MLKSVAKRLRFNTSFVMRVYELHHYMFPKSRSSKQIAKSPRSDQSLARNIATITIQPETEI